jgi:hypothetical protein
MEAVLPVLHSGHNHYLSIQNYRNKTACLVTLLLLNVVAHELFSTSDHMFDFQGKGQQMSNIYLF